MPYLELPGQDVTLWYRTNVPGDNIAGWDHARPTVLLLHPPFLDSDLGLDPQFADPRLHRAFNLVAFDQFTSGRTRNPLHLARDTWVDAALHALALETLHIPPCHVFAVQNISVNVALRFAMIFPERCLSLTLCSIPLAKDSDFAAQAYQEVFELWAYPKSLEDFEDANLELNHAMYNETLPTPLLDQIIAHWQVQYPPNRRTRTVDFAATMLLKTWHTAEELASIRQPVFIMHGDSSLVHPIEAAHIVHKALVNAAGGAKLKVIKGGPECLNIPPLTASQVNGAFLDFVLELPTLSPLRLPSPPILQSGFYRLIELSGDRSMSTRDFHSIWSFSRVSPENQAIKKHMLAAYAEGEADALSPLGPDGRPLRVFSERHDDYRFRERDTNPLISFTSVSS
ncbi:hypothetical protein BOTBODRAFT_33737 [Botryobasidium botryosum FD-172 SS1]|uniref:AB hydrolase-1 domain-containing protein n=1 Tax=Botryobasidium botryosum (strain FD-172 SS1) TaxID=930990 RepID=A0A067MEI7_BOTB1|nr:hypothetical protein BOTBODRAFT_33737 [Botryobasidium botryosum FD-172 SS1]